MSDFSNRIKKLRVERNLTQTQLAELINVPRYRISDWEIGRIEPDNKYLTIVASFFNVSVDYLLGRTNSRDVVIDDEYIRGLLIKNELIPADRELSREEFEDLLKKLGDIYKIIK